MSTQNTRADAVNLAASRPLKTRTSRSCRRWHLECVKQPQLVANEAAVPAVNMASVSAVKNAESNKYSNYVI